MSYFTHKCTKCGHTRESHSRVKWCCHDWCRCTSAQYAPEPILIRSYSMRDDVRHLPALDPRRETVIDPPGQNFIDPSGHNFRCKCAACQQAYGELAAS